MTFGINISITKLADKVAMLTNGRVTQITLDEKAYMAIWTDLRKKLVAKDGDGPDNNDIFLNTTSGRVQIVCEGLTFKRGLSVVDLDGA